MGKILALFAIRLSVSVNLLYAAIFLKFAGVPNSVALLTQMSQAVHGLVFQPVSASIPESGTVTDASSTPWDAANATVCLEK